jgi:putative ABC transport system ATP-binding protein
MIELYKISKIVRSGTEMLTILHSLDLSIPDGQFISLVGPSGSGKSTLLGLIAGLDAPTSGEILIDGENITGMNEDKLAELRGEKIGFVFQSFHLMPSLTALENILAPMEIRGLRDARERANRLLEDVDLVARAHHYPSQLSGGEQQRVAVARAFANGPSILLADEPTGNLDSRNGRHVFEMMVEMNRKRKATLVLVTHDHELAALADRQISLRDGRVVSDSDAIDLSREIEDTSMEALP